MTKADLKKQITAGKRVHGLITTSAKRYDSFLEKAQKWGIRTELVVKAIVTSPDLQRIYQTFSIPKIPRFVHASQAGRYSPQNVTIMVKNRILGTVRSLEAIVENLDFETAPQVKTTDPWSNPLAFISYSTKNKVVAGKIADGLKKMGIPHFLAHEDMKVSEKWAKRIMKELGRCTIFLPIVSKAFNASNWAPQEGGIAAFRDVLTLPVRRQLSCPVPRQL